MNRNVDDRLPEKPEEPVSSDCCGTGCVPCVFDLYEQDVKRWLAECERIQNGVTSDVSNEFVLRTDQYTRFTLENITQVTDDAFLYRFHIPDGGTLGLAVGQHIILRATINGKSVSRQYTPVSDLSTRGYFEVLIKLYPTGKMSQHIKQFTVGDEVPWRGPYGSFSYSPNSYHHIVILCAGTGIAPMVQVIRHVVDNEDDETFIHLYYSNRTYKDILCKSMLDSWCAYWNFDVTYCLTQDSRDQCRIKYGDKVQFGRIDCEMLKSALESFIRDKTLVLICGTKSFDKDMINHVKNIDFKNYFKF